MPPISPCPLPPPPDQPWISRLECELNFGSQLMRTTGLFGQEVKDFCSYGILAEQYTGNKWDNLIQFLWDIDPTITRVINIIRHGEWPTLEELQACPDVDPRDRLGGCYLHITYKLVDGVIWEQWVYVGAGGSNALSWTIDTRVDNEKLGIAVRRSVHDTKAQKLADYWKREDKNHERRGKGAPSATKHLKNQFNATSQNGTIYITKWIPIGYTEDFLECLRGVGIGRGNLTGEKQRTRSGSLAKIMEAFFRTLFGVHCNEPGFASRYSKLLPPNPFMNVSFQSSNWAAFYQTTSPSYTLTPEEKGLAEKVYRDQGKEFETNPPSPLPTPKPVRKCLPPWAYLTWQQQLALPTIAHILVTVPPVFESPKEAVFHAHLLELRANKKHIIQPNEQLYRRVADQLFGQMGHRVMMEAGKVVFDVGDLRAEFQLEAGMNGIGGGPVEVPNEEQAVVRFSVSGALSNLGRIIRYSRFAVDINFDDVPDYKVILDEDWATAWDGKKGEMMLKLREWTKVAQALLDSGRKAGGREVAGLDGIPWEAEARDDEIEVDDAEVDSMEKGIKALPASEKRGKSVLLKKGDVLLIGDGQKAPTIPQIHVLYQLSEKRAFYLVIVRPSDIGKYERNPAQMEDDWEKAHGSIDVGVFSQHLYQPGATITLSDQLEIVPHRFNMSLIGRAGKSVITESGAALPEVEPLVLMLSEMEMSLIQKWALHYKLPLPVMRFLEKYYGDASLDRALLNAARGDQQIGSKLEYFVGLSRANSDGFQL